MITQINDLPQHVVGFKATGNVTKDEYDTVIVPAVDKLAAEKGEIRYLFVLDTAVGNLTAGAWYDDIVKVGLKHLTQWKKIAIVSDQSGVNKVTDIGGHIMPGEVKAFTIADVDKAKAWLAE